jgi:hypothetical protein
LMSFAGMGIGGDWMRNCRRKAKSIQRRRNIEGSENEQRSYENCTWNVTRSQRLYIFRLGIVSCLRKSIAARLSIFSRLQKR